MVMRYIDIESVRKAQNDLDEGQSYLDFVGDCNDYVTRGKTELRWGGKVVTLNEVRSNLKDAVYTEEKAEGLVALLLRYDPNNFEGRQEEQVMEKAELGERISALERRVDAILGSDLNSKKCEVTGVDPARGRDNTAQVGYVEWLPVSGKEHPKNNSYCLIATEDSVYRAVWNEGVWREYIGNVGRYSCVTHWAELPVPPP